MAFVQYLGGLQPNTALYAESKHVILSHPSATNALVLAEFGESGYSSSLNNFVSSDGRSLQGKVKIAGGSFKPPEQWNITECTITELQLRMFEVLISLQSSSLVPITLQDKFEKYQYLTGSNVSPTWLSGSPTTNALGYAEGYAAWNVWIDVDANYRSYIGYGRYLLQFTAVQT